MRPYQRRKALYGLIVLCGLVFFVTVQRHSRALSALSDPDHIGQNRGYYNPAALQKPFEGVQNISRHVLPQLWNPGADKYNDRILAQISHVPVGYSPDSPLKRIYVPAGLGDTPMGQKKFTEQKCPVDKCFLTSHHSKTQADAVLIQNSLDGEHLIKQHGQIWILWLLESPLNSISLQWLNDKINWTASYRTDSTIVTPYEKFVPFSNISNVPEITRRNYAKGKTKLVAWFVSNCNTFNMRLGYAHALQRHIKVDIYGTCGSMQCTRGTRGGKCDKILNRDYKFYLSFENSNCEYYITEKLFWNALFNDVVPVVMGGRKEDYEAIAPPNSFIHVDDFSSPKFMADYLLMLNEHDDLYSEYFNWKNTGSFVNTKFWCRMCAMLHDVNKPVTWFDDVEGWWRTNNTCTKGRWDNPKSMIHNWDLYLLP